MACQNPKPCAALAVDTDHAQPPSPAAAIRELRHPAATGYRYQDIQDTERING
jgi:hypothetical protein